MNRTIETATAALADACKALIPVKRELKTWRPGRPEHVAAMALKARLDQQIKGFKKRIADASRLKRNPEVLRRHKIRKLVERLATYDMGLEKADSVLCYVNDAAGGKVEAITENTKNWNYYAKSFKFPKV
ncbi:hypothetical protein GGI1_24246, partial [Acidithiobacillus sp. GGI-221]